jgi:leader peptidase (prepilin peptidase) / N-methyltransferase
VLFAIMEGYARARGHEGLGMGDVKMLAMIGAFLGWQLMLLTLVLASFAGSVVGVGMMAAQRGGMKTALPFGTFLAVGALVAAVAGRDILTWYLAFYQ